MKKASPTCGICQEKKALSGKRLICLSCNRRRSARWQQQHPDRANAKNRAWKKRNLERVRAASRRSKLFTQYGMTVNAYAEMLSNQGGVCAICLRPEEKKHRSGADQMLSVDHSHKTGAVRGLLCNNCNVGIAHFKENGQALVNAAAYLKRWEGV